MDFPPYLDVVIEIPAWSGIKRSSTGKFEFWSPIPSPFNYGSAMNTAAEDGEPWDVVVLGGRLPRGHRALWRVLGVVKFRDHGNADDKWVVGVWWDERDRRRLSQFFRVYAWTKRWIGRDSSAAFIEILSAP